MRNHFLLRVVRQLIVGGAKVRAEVRAKVRVVRVKGAPVIVEGEAENVVVNVPLAVQSAVVE